MKRIFPVILLVILIAAFLGGCGKNHAQNEFSLPENRKNVPAALEVYGGEDIGFSFLYPYGMNVSWNDEDGACISNDDGKVPYVLVNKTAKNNMTPEKYFKSSDKQILKEFDKVQSSKIHEVPLNGKTLYMTRYQCMSGNSPLVIDRYIEIYQKCYFQYTVISNTADEMNTAMYYVATTLSPEPECYFGEYSEKLAAYSQDDTGISMQLPVMFDIRELTLGYLASCNDAIMLAVKCTEDDNGDPIYNRQNFMDAAASDPNFVAGYVGADSTVFGSGSKTIVNGREFYVYPMTMQTAGEKFTGEFYLANAEESGCIVVCYAVKDDGPRAEMLSELCLKSVNTVEY